MKKWTCRRLPGPFCALVVLAISACASFAPVEAPPRVNLVDLRPVQMSLFEQRYVAMLRVLNPNDASLEVTGMDYTIYINGERFADGVSSERFSLPPYGEIVLKVPLTSSLVRLVEQFKALDRRGTLAFDYRISGRMSISGLPGRYPFGQDGRLDLSPSQAGDRLL